MKLNTQQLLGLSLIQDNVIDAEHPLISAKIGGPLVLPPDSAVISEAVDNTLSTMDTISHQVIERAHPNIVLTRSDKNGHLEFVTSGDEPMTKTNYHIWLNGLYGVGDTESDSNDKGFDFEAIGLVAGIDLYHNSVSNEFLGFFGSLAEIETNVNLAGTHRDDGDVYQVGLYGSKAMDDFFVKGLASVFWTEHDIERTTINGKARGDTEGFGYSGSLEFSFEKEYQGHQHHSFVSPFVSLGFSSLRADDYTEVGGDNNRVDETTTHHLFSMLGGKLSSNVLLGNIRLIPQLCIAWKHEFLDTNSDTDTVLVPIPNTAASPESASVGRDSLFTDVSLHASPAAFENFDVFVAYTGQFNSEFGGHYFNAGANIKW